MSSSGETPASCSSWCSSPSSVRYKTLDLGISGAPGPITSSFLVPACCGLDPSDRFDSGVKSWLIACARALILANIDTDVNSSENYHLLSPHSLVKLGQFRIKLCLLCLLFLFSNCRRYFRFIIASPICICCEKRMVIVLFLRWMLTFMDHGIMIYANFLTCLCEL